MKSFVTNLYSNDVLTVAAIINPNGCPGVRFVNDKFKARFAMNPQGRKLLDDLQQAFHLSKQEFYGY